MSVRVSFPGGVVVNAEVAGHVVSTDQSVRHGGTDSAPPPFDLFLASIATCAGFYALRFCQKRNIDTQGLGVSLDAIRDPERKRVERVVIQVELPPEFPDKYRKAIVHAMDLCAVKRHILEPPEFEIEVATPAAQVNNQPEVEQRIQLL
ncbi:MAG: osmotically inducible protein OsmC [Myxococcales bacterium]|nr:osmotically inducible protein OsmC [Myxococcales bacterium]